MKKFCREMCEIVCTQAVHNQENVHKQKLYVFLLVEIQFSTKKSLGVVLWL